RVLLPKKILYRNTAQIGPGDPKAVDPPAKSTFHGRVSDIVIYAHERWVEPGENLLQIPDRRAYQTDPRVRVIHGANPISRVQLRQARRTRMECLQLLPDR